MLRKAFKTEGTTQTYGQLIVFPAREKSIIAKSQSETQTTTQLISPKDTMVRIISQSPTESSSKSLVLENVDKSNISIAAFSSEKEHIAVVNQASLSSQDTSSAPKVNTLGMDTVSTANINVEEYAIVVGSAIKSREEIKKCLTEAQKSNLSISFKSKFSESAEHNNIKSPELFSSFIYNFYDHNERNIETQEDPKQDPLLSKKLQDVPLYVELSWKPSSTTEDITGIRRPSQETQTLKRDVFFRDRGVSTSTSDRSKYSFSKTKKEYELYNNNGIKQELVDVHQLDKAMTSTNNKYLFRNMMYIVADSDKKYELPIIIKNNEEDLKR
jgi:hypothetical protein